MLACPLCKNSHNDVFYQDKRDYYRCRECSLVFVPAEQYVSREREKAIYDQHNNSPDDKGYRRFLKRLLIPVLDSIADHSEGLDFGSGPGPTLAIMFAEKGYQVKNYDIFYAPDNSLLEQQYDFITASEVVEHLHYPGRELNSLWSCLSPGGVLGLMTKRVLDQQAFAHWHYKNDVTHVCFFSESSFRWLAQKWNAAISFPEKDVVLFKKFNC